MFVSLGMVFLLLKDYQISCFGVIDRSLVLLPEDFVYDTYDPGAKSLSAGVKDVGKILYLKPFLYCEEPDKKMYDLGEYTATYSISDLIHSEINNPNKVSPNGRGLLLGF